MVSVVVPAYAVERYLPACLDSLLAQTHRALDVVVVDDGSPDASGEIAEAYAARDRRVRVLHTENHGLGAARNEGLRHVRGEYVGFADSDDVVPPTAYRTLLGSLQHSGSDFATGSVAWLEGGGLREPPWMRRLHTPERRGTRAADHPEVLGDVFAWNKLFRRSFWEATGLSWPEGIRYEDQPTTTEAYLAGRFDVLGEIVYHWRIREEGGSITQQRASVADLRDRWETKRRVLASVESSPQVSAVLDVVLDRVLPGDLHRYFVLIPGCADDWWELLVAGVREFWVARGRSLTGSGLPPVHRLTGWLVEQGRREDAAAVMTYAAGLAGPAPRVDDGQGPRLDVPVIDPATVDRAALAVRPSEM